MESYGQIGVDGDRFHAVVVEPSPFIAGQIAGFLESECGCIVDAVHPPPPPRLQPGGGQGP